MAIVFQSKQSEAKGTISIWVLVVSNIMVFLVTWNVAGGGGYDENHDLLRNVEIKATPSTQDVTAAASTDYIFLPKQGKAVALPSVRVAKEEFKSNSRYGGVGDKPHLGGFTDLDHHGVSPKAWKWMVEYVGVQSIMDVGCGRGISTSWFYFHGLDVICAEGSHDAIENTVLPDPSIIVEHDFSRGPWWPEKTYDAVWCVEFMEHVGRNLQQNYLTAFRKAAIIFASHSNWGGHHHVEVHDDAWWINKFAMFGFVYSEELTKKVRSVAHSERYKGFAPNGKDMNPQHIWLSMQVFINPAVAALPEHAHLLADPGCFLVGKKGGIVNRECGELDPEFPGQKQTVSMESVLPEKFKALKLTADQDEKWFAHIKARVEQHEPEEGKQKK